MSKLFEIILALQSHASFPHAMRECQILILSLLHVAVTRFFNDRRSTLELFVQISWQAQHFRAFRADFVAGAALSSLRADFVAGAALSLGRVALAAARCAFSARKVSPLRALGVARHLFARKVNPLRALGVSNRSRCGAAHILRLQSEPSAHFGRVEDRKANPLRTLGGSNRSRCGAAHMLRSHSEPSACFGWAESLSLAAENMFRSRSRDT